MNKHYTGFPNPTKDYKYLFIEGSEELFKILTKRFRQKNITL